MSPESAARINSDYQLPLAFSLLTKPIATGNPGNGSSAFQWSTFKNPLFKHLSKETGSDQNVQISGEAPLTVQAWQHCFQALHN